MQTKPGLFRFRVLVICLAIGLALVSGGCAAGSASSTDDGQLTIVSSFLPMYIFTANLIEGVDGVTLTNMAAPDVGCLHDYQLLPTDMAKLETADVFVFNGAGMENFLTDIAARNSDVITIEATKGISLLPMPDGSANPHVWLSIPLAIQEVHNISLGLQAADPEHQGQYQANETAYVTRLEALDLLYRTELAAVSQRSIITFHEAFPYLAAEYNLTIAAVIEHEPGSEPTAAELANTIELIREKKISALFAEPQYSTRIAETIAAETGATIYLLDPVVTGVAGPATYEQKMTVNLEILIKALK